MSASESFIQAASAMGVTQPGIRVQEVHGKSILNKSGITDWTVNCYVGCHHACRYCYARFATRFSHPGEAWGSFVDVKVNAAELIAREAQRKRIGRVFVSSVCDGWQPLEERYTLTRQCLEILLRHGFPVTILTKSALVRRDLDLMAGNKDLEFGVTITTLHEGMSRLFEPASSSPAERAGLLEEAALRGIRTYAFLGPLMPHLSDSRDDLIKLLRLIKEVGVDYCYVDRLNPRFGVWPSLMALLDAQFPHLVDTYRRILFNARARQAYARSLAARVRQAAVEAGFTRRIKLCF